MLKLELESIIKFILVFGFLLLISETCFNVDIIKIVVNYKFDKIIIGTILWYFICDAKKYIYYYEKMICCVKLKRIVFLRVW